MTAPQVPDSASPFWLRLYGHWVRLQGIMPLVDKASERAFSELTTVDGHRYEQRAPRGPRSWSVDYRYATAAATAALESAAYDYNFNDPSMRTLLLDTNEAKINMVPPDILKLWSSGSATSGPLVYNVGETDGLPMWLPTYNGDGVLGYRSVFIPVRAGVTYTATVWTTLGTGVQAIQVLGAAAGSANGLNGSTVSNPHQATVVFTPVADGTAEVRVTIGFTAGLMVYEGNCAPTSYRAGRNMPCSISVQEPSTKTNLIWRDCDPCKLPREHTSWILHEVAMDAVTPLDVGVS